MSTLLNSRDSDQGQYEALAPASWVAMTLAECAEARISPNRAYYRRDDDTVIVVVVKQSANGDGFALSKGVVDFFGPLVARERLKKCAVRLVARDGTVVGEEQLTALVPRLEKAQVNASVAYDGGYWWLNRDFSISPIGGGRSSEARPGWLPSVDAGEI